jgi:hypothetical protein
MMVVDRYMLVNQVNKYDNIVFQSDKVNVMSPIREVDPKLVRLELRTDNVTGNCNGIFVQSDGCRAFLFIG